MNRQRAIADLHCHYPMHLVPDDYEPPGYNKSWLARLLDFLQSKTVGLLARILSDRSWGSGWRVDIAGLEAGGAQLVCSVLYWPAAEFSLATLRGAPPVNGYFEDLKYQLDCVEKDIQRHIAGGAPLLIAKRAADIARTDRIVFVHCVEGGFQLGPDIGAIDRHVTWLADQGVFYITVAHLFYRRVATNAPAIPLLTDGEYNAIFRQPRKGLTKLGEALIRAMYKHKVVIDISHMSERATADTFALIEKLDAETNSDPRDYPLIACHIGMRNACMPEQEYNLTPETARRIQARGGLIGLIMAQHQLGKTSSDAESRKVLCKHLEAIEQLGNGHRATAFGSDLDGFIKPTLEGIERAADMQKLASWVDACAPGDADAILCENARRVIKHTFEVREAERDRAPAARSLGGAIAASEHRVGD